MRDKNNIKYLAGFIALLSAVLIAGGIGAALMIREVHEGKEAGPLDLPAASEVVACYYIPDLAKPYEQKWWGGERVETLLYWLGRVPFVESAAPDESRFVSCCVIATNERQIVIHIDDRGIGWVYDQERGWLREQQ